MVGSYRGLFEGWEIALAKELIGRFRSRWRSLERESFEDVLQECLVHWMGVRDRFDPAREVSRRAYMARVMQNKLMDMVRELESDRRRINALAVSLDQPIGDEEDGPTLLEVWAERSGADAVHGDSAAASDARIDLAAVLSRLTPAQRRLCQLLGEEGLPVQAAAQRLGIPRGTLYEEIKRIRKVFAQHGLADYLEG